MYSHIAKILAGLLLFCGFVAAGWAATIEESVAVVFAGFKQALATHDGAGAARYIDERTEAFYEKIRRSALYMRKDQLLKQPRSFQIGVFSARSRFGKEDLVSTDGRGLYAKLAAAGALGTQAILGTLVKIQPSKPGASAIAYVSLAGRPDTVGLRVFTEGGGWKIDMSRLLEAEAKELQNQIGVAPVSEKLWIPLAQTN